MATPVPISDTVILEAINTAVQSVFRTMIRQEIKFVEKVAVPPDANLDPARHIIGSVGFVGKANGTVYLGLEEAFAQHLTGLMLGMSVAEVAGHGDEVLIDAIGEITNMTVGGFKNALCDLGHPCMLTLPTIVLGTNLAVAPIKGTVRHIFHFESGGKRFSADIHIKAD